MKDLIVESLYSKYGYTEPNKKRTITESVIKNSRRRPLKEYYDDDGSEFGYDDEEIDYSVGGLLSEDGRFYVSVVIADLPDGFHWHIAGGESGGPFDTLYAALRDCYESNADRTPVNSGDHSSDRIEIRQIYPEVKHEGWISKRNLEYIMGDQFYESLILEKRNPENDEVNAVIKKWANGKGKLSKKDKEILDKNDIWLDSGVDMKTGRFSSAMQGGQTRGGYVGDEPVDPVELEKADVRSKHPDFDYANYLRKDRAHPDDVETPLPKGSRMSRNQMRKLQPYDDDKTNIRMANRLSSKHKAKAHDEREIASGHHKTAQTLAKNAMNVPNDYGMGDRQWDSAMKQEREANLHRKYADYHKKQAKEYSDFRKDVMDSAKKRHADRKVK